MKDNFEDYFRDSFEDFQEDPNGTTWEKIKQSRQTNGQHSARNEQPDEELYRRILHSFESIPNFQVWLNIKSYLRLKKWAWFSSIAVSVIIGVFTIGHLLNPPSNPTGLISNSTPAAPSELKTSENLELKEKNQNQNILELEQAAEAKNQNNLSVWQNLPKVSAPKNLNVPVIPKVMSTSSSNVENVETSTEENRPGTLEDKEKSSGDLFQNKSTFSKSSSQEVNVVKGEIYSVSPTEGQMEKIENPKESAAMLALDTLQKETTSMVQEDNKDEVLIPADQHKRKKKIKYTSETNINNEGSPNKYYIATGPDFFGSNINTQGLNPLYTDLRKNFESNQFSWHLSAGASHRFKGGISIQSGIQIQSFGFNSSYDFSQKVHIHFTNANGVVIDDTITTTIRNQGGYRLTYLEIPFQIKYSFGQKRLSYHAYAALIPAVLAGRSGRILSYDDLNPSVKRLKDIPTSDFQRFHYSVSAGAGFSYQVNHDYSLLFEPSYRFQMTSVYSKNHPVSEKLFGLSVLTGIRYHLD